MFWLALTLASSDRLLHATTQRHKYCPKLLQAAISGAFCNLVQFVALQGLEQLQAAEELHDAGRQQADMAVAETEAGANQQEPCEGRKIAVSADAPTLLAAKPELVLAGSAGEAVGGRGHQEDTGNQLSAKPEWGVQHAEPQAHHQEVCSTM